MVVYAAEKKFEDYGLPSAVVLRILGKWWYRRDAVGLVGDQWYIPDEQGREEMVAMFYKEPKSEGKIPALTPEEHAAGFAAYREKWLSRR